jgi:hypothetical protein
MKHDEYSKEQPVEIISYLIKALVIAVHAVFPHTAKPDDTSYFLN